MPSGRSHGSSPECRSSREAPGEAVREHDRQRHQLGGLVGGVAEHHALVAGAAGVDPCLDLGRLLVEAGEHDGVVGVEALAGPVVADAADDAAGDRLGVDLGVRGDLAGQDDQVAGDQRLARDPGQGVLGEVGVEDRVGDLVGDLVRVALGDGLRGQDAAIRGQPDQVLEAVDGGGVDASRHVHLLVPVAAAAERRRRHQKSPSRWRDGH